jgi:hypothetical protein
MSFHKIVLTIAVASAFLLVPHSSRAQLAKGPLANVRSIKCTFPVMAVGTWGDKEPEVKVKPSNRELQFDAINTDEGTATSTDLKSGYGKYDIIVRYAGGYLHFIQSFLDGPLYTTTILEKKTASGKFKAMHSRHEYTDFALIGFTSSPEQYYGECEILQ